MGSGKNYSNVTIHKDQKFNKLTVIKYEFTKTYNKCNYHYYWSFKCDCGNIIITNKNSVLKGVTTSCGCFKSQKSSETFKKINENKTVIKGLAAFNRIYASYKHHAENRNYSFELTKDEFLKLILKNCYYCNRIPEQKAFNKHKTDYIFYNGIDRINNDLGYTIKNCVPCCKHCNRAKMSLTVEQFLQLIKNIYNHKIKNGN